MLITDTQFHINGWSHTLSVDQITHLSAYTNYSWIHLVDGRKYLVARPLNFLQPHLPHFLRLHRSYLLNPAYLEKIIWRERTPYQVALTTGLCLPLARRKVKELHQWLSVGLAQPPVAICLLTEGPS